MYFRLEGVVCVGKVPLGLKCGRVLIVSSPVWPSITSLILEQLFYRPCEI